MGSVDAWQLANAIYRASGVTRPAGDACAADLAGLGLLLGRLGGTRAQRTVPRRAGRKRSGELRSGKQTLVRGVPWLTSRPAAAGSGLVSIGFSEHSLE
jgi:hypothetical protein